MRTGFLVLIIFLICFSCRNTVKEKKRSPEKNAVHDPTVNSRPVDTSANGILKLIDEFEKGRGSR